MSILKEYISLKLEEKSNSLQTEGKFFINNEEIFDYSNNNDYSSFSMFPDLNFNSGTKKDKFINTIKFEKVRNFSRIMK